MWRRKKRVLVTCDSCVVLEQKRIHKEENHVGKRWRGIISVNISLSYYIHTFFLHSKSMSGGEDEKRYTCIAKWKVTGSMTGWWRKSGKWWYRDSILSSDCSWRYCIYVQLTKPFLGYWQDGEYFQQWENRNNQENLSPNPRKNKLFHYNTWMESKNRQEILVNGLKDRRENNMHVFDSNIFISLFQFLM